MPTEEEKEEITAVEEKASAPLAGPDLLPAGNVWSEPDEVEIEHPVVPPHPI